MLGSRKLISAERLRHLYSAFPPAPFALHPCFLSLRTHPISLLVHAVVSSSFLLVMAEFEPSDKSAPNHINRYAHRSDFSEATVYGIVDESLICHVGFKLEDDDPGDWPVV